MELYAREKYLKKIRAFYHSEDIIKVITGVRRCGKSSIMALIADELRAAGIPEDRLITLNLDKRPYRHIKTADALEKTIAEKTKAADFLEQLTQINMRLPKTECENRIKLRRA